MTRSGTAMKALGQAIQSQRSRMGLTQTDLANLAGVSLNFVSQVESGKTTARIGKVLDLLQSLGMCFSLEYGKQSIVIRTIEAEK